MKNKYVINLLWFKRTAIGHDIYATKMELIEARSDHEALGIAIAQLPVGFNLESWGCLNLADATKTEEP